MAAVRLADLHSENCNVLQWVEQTIQSVLEDNSYPSSSKKIPGSAVVESSEVQLGTIGESRLVALNRQLSREIFDTNNDIEAAMKQLIASAPLLGKQLEKVKSEANVFAKRVDQLARLVAELPSSASVRTEKRGKLPRAFDPKDEVPDGDPLEYLIKLETRRENIATTAEKLSHQILWEHSCASAEQHLGNTSGDLCDAAESILQLEKTCNVLEDLPGHEERRLIVRNLRQNFDNELLPRLRGTLGQVADKQAQLEELCAFSSALAAMGEASAFERAYVTIRSEEWLAEWAAVDFADQGRGAEEVSNHYARALQAFLTSISRLLNSEIETAKKLFGSQLGPLKVLPPLVEAVFQKIASGENSLAARTNSITLAGIYKLRTATQSFLLDLYATFKHFLDYFEKQTMSKANAEESVENSLISVLSIFQSFQDGYSAMEKKELHLSFAGVFDAIMRLHSGGPERNDGNGTGFREGLTTLNDVLADSRRDAMKELRKSMDRCDLATSCVCMPQMREAVDEFLEEFFSLVSDSINILRGCSAKQNSNDAAASILSLAYQPISPAVHLSLAVVQLQNDLLKLHEDMKSWILERTQILRKRAGEGKVDRIELDRRALKVDHVQVQRIDDLAESAARPSSTGDAESESGVLPRAFRACLKSQKDAWKIAHEIILLPVEQLLRPFCDMAVWTQFTAEDAEEDEVASSHTTNEAVYGQSDYATSLGENLLDLVQRLEPLFQIGSSDEDSNASDAVSVNWASVAHLAEGEWDGAAIQLRIRHAKLAVASGMEKIAKLKLSLPELWLNLASQGLQARLVRKILGIKHLSRYGCLQLSEDLNYLATVISAVGVVPAPILAHTRELVSMKFEELSKLADSVGHHTADEQLMAVAPSNLVLEIARKRGILTVWQHDGP